MLDPLVVDASSPISTVPSLQQSRERLGEVAGGTNLVDPESYLTGRASTVADTFAYEPGVVAQSRFGSDEARLSIRGSGLQRTFHGRGIRVLQDGVPINLADGGFDFQALDPLAASHILVWRGANALAYGSSTLGGAIDYISKTGRSHPGTGFRAEAGSYGYLRTRIEHGGASPKGDFHLSLSQALQDGFREHAAQSAQRLLSNFGLLLADDLETRFFLTTVHTDSELPGNLTKAELNHDPSLADTSPFGARFYDNRRDFELVRLANTTTLHRDDFTWDVSAAWTYKDLDHPITPFAGVIDQLSNDLLLSTRLRHEHLLFGRPNTLVAGLLHTYGETRDSRYENVRGRRGALRSSDDQTASNLEAWIENQHSLGSGFVAIVGASAARNTRKVERRFTRSTAHPPFYFPPAAGATFGYEETYTGFSPKIGLLWEGQNLQVFANLSRSYEPPSFSETVTANTPRDAQTGTTLELGTRGTRGAVRWDFVLYHARIQNELLTLNDPLNPGITTTVNANDTTHSGIELGTELDVLGSPWIETTPNHRLVLRGAWTYSRFRFDNDPVYGDNRIAGLPPHLIRAELLWENRCGWYAGPTVEWIPVKSYIDHRNTFAADPYALLGFKLGRRVEEGLSWFLEARNLLEERYAATHGVIENANATDQRQFLPGEGRSFYAGVEYRW